MSRGPSLARMILESAESRPGLRLGTADDPLELSEALALAAGRAAELLDSGLKPGQRVALVASTSTDYIVTWMACVIAGTPVALVNPTYPAELVEQMIAPLAPALVLDAHDILVARRAGRDDPARAPGLDVDPSATVSFMHTSGTTGLPKFCAQSNNYFIRLAGAVGKALALTPDDRVLAPLPMFHINPMGYGLITSLLARADLLAVERFSASGFWPTVIDEEVTVLVLHAPPVEILKKACDPENSTGHRVRTMFYADGAFLQRFGVPAAVSGYGSTEAAGLTHLKQWSVADEIPFDASHYGGPARPDIEWRLDDEGIIFVRDREPGTMFDGYVRSEGLDPARNADGWFDTGDLGRMDSDGNLVFIERRADSIRVKGEFVPIQYVEAHLRTVEGLHDLALGKRAGELGDDELLLYVVADEVPLRSIAAALLELPRFMHPSSVLQVAKIPRDEAAGKVQRRRLGDTEVLTCLAM